MRTLELWRIVAVILSLVVIVTNAYVQVMNGFDALATVTVVAFAILVAILIFKR
jgi:hypothetical protein